MTKSSQEFKFNDDKFSPEEYLFWNMIDLISMGICFVVHRSIKFTLFDIHIQDLTQNSIDTESLIKESINNNIKVETLLNGDLVNSINYVNLLKTHLFFPNQFDIIKNYQCICISCNRNIAASRFAPHLEKCLGMGRNSSRIATKKIKQSLYLENTNNVDEEDSNHQLLARDYENSLSTFYDGYNQASDNSSTSSISNHTYKSKVKKFYKKKKKVVENTFVKSHTIKKDRKLLKLDKDSKYQIQIEKGNLESSTSIASLQKFDYPILNKQLFDMQQNQDTNFIIKNVLDIKVGDYVALSLRFIIDYINSYNSIQTHSFINFVKLFNLSANSTLLSNYEFINQFNNFTLYSNRWLGLIDKLVINDSNKKIVYLRWIKLTSGDHTALSQHLIWEIEDTLTENKHLSTPMPIPNTYFPNHIVDYNAIGALFNFDISKPMPEKLLHLLQYMSLVTQGCV